jgi:PTS system fructose-specific IIA component/PTS system nitrogen regulatory IIA component
LQATTKEHAIRELVNGLCAVGRVAAEHAEAIIGSILKREELGSTGIGRGVAVPHTKHASVGGMICAVALSKAGLDFASLDGEQVHILFLLVSPPERPVDHLRALESITRHLKSDWFCNSLKNATSQAEVLNLLQEADETSY